MFGLRLSVVKGELSLPLKAWLLWRSVYLGLCSQKNVAMAGVQVMGLMIWNTSCVYNKTAFIKAR